MPAFVEPPWDSPLDAEREIAAIPESATISGMFLAAVAEQGRRHGGELASARDRYVPFQFYPLREHARLLIEAAERVFPQRPRREGLRRLGRGAPAALIGSTLGRVVLGSAEGVSAIVAAMARAYALNLKPGAVVVAEQNESSTQLRFEQVHYFLDCHHVGTFEGALRYAGVTGRVLVAPSGAGAADFLLDWSS